MSNELEFEHMEKYLDKRVKKEVEEMTDVLKKRLEGIDDYLAEIHRIVMDLHKQWNAPSDMTDAIEEAMKNKVIRPSRRIIDPEA
jgi:hypothetical protein